MNYDVGVGVGVGVGVVEDEDEYKLEKIVFSELLGIHTKDTTELNVFSKNNRMFAFVRKDLEHNYYLHFITAGGYQFALATQKRNDRDYKIRTFKDIEVALKCAERFRVKSVTVLFAPTELMLWHGYLMISS